MNQPATLSGVVKAFWIAIAIAVLAITLWGFDGKPNSDIGVFLAWSMLVLAVPSSFVVALVFSGIAMAADRFFSVVIPTTYVSLALTWACFAVVGYWQWFVLLPWIRRKWAGGAPKQVG